MLMTKTARTLAARGWILRSGGADGADSAFEEGAPADQREIYLPWRGFNGNPSTLYGVRPTALHIASTIHPAWLRLTRGGRACHGRNVYQVLGHDHLTPSAFLICWTPGGKDVGGTRTALYLATVNQIPVLNLGRTTSLDEQKELLCAFLEGVGA